MATTPPSPRGSGLFISAAEGEAIDPRYRVPLVDPKQFLQTCLDHGLPTENWFNKANRVYIPLGKEPTTATVLIRKKDMETVGIAQSYDASTGTCLTLDDGANAVTIWQLYPIRATCVSPGRAVRTPATATTAETVKADDDAVYLLELGDWRYRYRYGITDRDDQIVQYTDDYGAFNLLQDIPSSEYRADTKNSGTAFTWTTLFQSLWTDAAGLGPSPPTLPFTPHGTPEGFDYRRWRAWDAVHHFLSRIGCALKVDAAKDRMLEIDYSVVRLGTADAIADTELTRMNEYPGLWDDFPMAVGEPLTAVSSISVPVRFRRYPVGPDVNASTQIDNYAIVTATAATSVGSVYPGSPPLLFDDLIARIDVPGPGYTNQTDLDARAQERADDFVRIHEGFDRRLNRVFAGIFPNAVTKVLGSTVQAIAYYDCGNGYHTQVIAGPMKTVIDWRPPEGGTVASWNMCRWHEISADPGQSADDRYTAVKLAGASGLWVDGLTIADGYKAGTRKGKGGTLTWTAGGNTYALSFEGGICYSGKLNGVEQFS